MIVFLAYSGTKDISSSFLIIGFVNGEILSYDFFTDRIHEIHSPYQTTFPANLSSFGYLTDLDIYYAGLEDGSIWQLTPQHNQKLQASWNLAFQNETYGAVNLLLPFMKGDFFDLYFGSENGLISEYNTFYQFGNTVYPGVIGSATPILMLYIDHTPFEAIYQKFLISAFSNGALIQTNVGPAGEPQTQIIQAIGSQISNLLTYRCPQGLWLIVGTASPTAGITIFSLNGGSVLYRYTRLSSSVSTMILISDSIDYMDYLIVGLNDGSIYQFNRNIRIH